MATNMDILVMGSQMLYKQEQHSNRQNEVDDYMAQFQPD
jgi:hypothetical protein